MPFAIKDKKLVIIAAIFILSSIIAYFFDKGILFWNPKETHLGFSLELFTNKLQERSKKSDKILAEVYSLLGDSSTNRNSLLAIADYINSQQLSNKGYAVFVYQNDSLKFWSSTKVEISRKFVDTLVFKRIYQGGTGYYLQNHLLKGHYKLLCLSLIKHDYPLHNKFLVPAFYSGLQVPPSVKIETNEKALGIDVADIDGHFLLKLMPAFAKFSDKPYFNTSIFFYLTSLFLFLLLIYELAKKASTKYNNLFILGLLIITFVSLRYWMIADKFPANIYHAEMFKPQYFSQSFWFASLGDFLMNALLLFFLSFFVFRSIEFRQKIKNFPFGKVLLLILVFVFFEFSYQYINNLIQNSSIHFALYKVLKLNIFSFYGYTIIALLLGAFWLLLEKLVKEFGEITRNENIIAFIVAIPIALVINVFSYEHNFFLSYLFLFVFSFTVYYFRSVYKKAVYFSYVLFVVLLALYTVFLVQKDVMNKKTETEQVIAINLAAERDPIAELFFIQKQVNLQNDTFIIQSLSTIYSSPDYIRKYIAQKYLKGYLSKYDLQVTISSPTDSIWIDDEDRAELCYNYFTKVKNLSGSRLQHSDFYFLDNLNGRISYLGWLKYKISTEIPEISLFLELDSKLQTEEAGYPELLLDKKIARKSRYKDFQYAKYKYGTLITQHGDYPYDIKLNLKQPKDSEFSNFTKGGFHHLAYWLDKDNVIIVSRKENTLMDYLISFSYLFLAFYLLVSFLVIIYNLLHHKFKIRFGLKWQIQFSMVAMLVVSLLVVGGGTVYYIYGLYRDKHYNTLNEKIQLVNNELAHKLLYEPRLTPRWNNYEFRNLNELLMKFADVLYIDIHLYDENGQLLATSRPEIFKDKLQSKQMNYEAYYQLIIKQKQKFVHHEKIGKLDYLSAYLPFRNVDNKILAYVNLPYFAKQSEMSSEIYTLLVTVLNVFVLLILLATFIALFTGNQITQPLQLIQQSMREIQLGKSNKAIAYSKDDEIGQLVSEYNRMLAELQRSAEMLGQSERESAWREMAKQIAHEIKNPLTPMKLSVQFLKRSWDAQDQNFEQRMTKVTQTLIEQIDALSAIATAFSNFAKMPRSQMQLVDIIEVVHHAVSLYDADEKVDVSFVDKKLTHLNVFVDKKELQRVFINLIKNGIQAIPEGIRAKIEINIKQVDSLVEVSVKDNGSGIPEELHDRIFRPNFTTKSAGMGLGLAITKNIIESEKGKIWFETKINHGTTFFVQLPLVE